MRVSVSIVTHQSAGHLDACLAGVREQGDLVREVLVVDAGSSDGTAEQLRQRFPGVDLCALDHNAGYAAGHNRNFARARGAYVLALNPDVRLRRGYLARLCARLERDPSLGAATGCLLRPGGERRVDSAGIAYDRGRTRFVDRGRGRSAGRFARECDLFGACGAATLYRRRAVRALSGPGQAPFVERFFMYYEDVDLSWRLRRGGWRIRYCPDAEAVHARGGSGADPGFVEYHLVRNRLWVSLRNAGPAELLRELPGLACFEAVKALQSLRRPHLRAALRDQLRGLPATWRERRQLARGA